MPGAQDVVRSIGALRQRQQEMLDGLSGGPSGLDGAVRALVGFLRDPDNLLALLVCVAAVVGLYRLLRAERIIPAPEVRAGGSRWAALLSGRLARLVLFAVAAALGLLAVAMRFF